MGLKAAANLGNGGGIGDVNGPASSTTHALASYADETGKLIENNSNLVVANSRLTGLTPVGANDMAIKSYVDSFVAGLTYLPPCLVATTENLVGAYDNGSSGVGATISITATGVLTIDGVALALNDDVLIKDQTNTFENGIYRVTTAGSTGVSAILTRRTDFDTSSEISEGSYTDINSGSENVGTTWVETGSGPFTIGTTPIVFSIFGQAQIQSDWDETNTAAVDYIKNKPNLLLQAVVTATMGATYDVNPTQGSVFILTWETNTVLDIDPPTLGAGQTQSIQLVIIPDTGADTLAFGSNINLVDANIPLVDNTVGKPTILNAVWADSKWQLTNISTYNDTVNIASDTSISLDYTGAAIIHITGTNTITSITSQTGNLRVVVFDDAGCTLTYDPIGIILPGQQNIVTQAGDIALFIGLLSDANAAVYCVSYFRADGTPISNLGTMAYQDADDVDISGGNINGTTIGDVTPAAGKFTFARQSADDSVTAAGTEQSDATQLTAAINVITSADPGTGVKLPAAVEGDRISVYNFGTNPIFVYSNSTETLNGIPGSAGFVILETEALIFEASSNSTWIFQSIGSMGYQDQTSVQIQGGIIDNTTIGGITPTLGTFTFIQRSVSSAVTAAGTNQSTATALTSSINNITTVASNTGVKLPPAVTGRIVDIYNNGANILSIYSNGAETINGVAGSFAKTLQNGNKSWRFIAISNSAWLYAPIGTMAYQDSFNVTITGGLADNLLIGANTPLTGNFTFVKQVPGNGITAAGTDQSTATALTTATNNVTTVASNTGVKLPLLAVGSVIKVYNNGANPLQVYSNSSETINGFAGATGITMTPNTVAIFDAIATGVWIFNSMVGDVGTMAYQDADDVDITGGAINDTEIGGTTPALGTFTFAQGSATDTIAAAGTTRADATALTTQYNNITTVSPNTGVVLPASAVGRTIIVYNNGANTLKIYAAGSDTINGTVGTTAISLEAGLAAQFDCIATNAWIYAPAAAGSGVESLSGNIVDNTDPTNPVVFSYPIRCCLVVQYGIGSFTISYSNGSSGVGATITNAGSQSALVIDGITLSVGHRVLWNELINQEHNGVYVVTNTGSLSTNWVLTRATDYDTTDDIKYETQIFVRSGNTYANSTFVMNNNTSVTVGTTLISFSLAGGNPLGSMAYQNSNNVNITGGTIIGVIGGYDLGPVYAASTVNLSATYSNGSAGVGATLTSTSNGALTLDGEAITVGDYVLIKNQTTTAQNGIYLSTQTGDGSNPWILTRATYFNTPTKMTQGSKVVVANGDEFEGVAFYLADTVTTVGTTSVFFSVFNSQLMSGGGIFDSSINSTTIGAITQADAQFYTPINAQTGTTYTIQASDCGKTVTFNNAAAITVTLPEQSTEVTAEGFFFNYAVIGAGAVTFVTEGSETSKGYLLARAGASGKVTRNTTTQWTLEGGTATRNGSKNFSLIGTIANSTGYYISLKFDKAATINSATQVAGSLGTAGTYTVKINGSNVGGLTTVTNATSVTTTNATSSNVVADNDTISFIVESTVAAVNYYMQINYTYYENV